MKRIALAVLSLILVAASVFGFMCAGTGITELDSVRASELKKTNGIRKSIELIEEDIELLAASDKDAQRLAKDVVTDKYGGSKLASGEKEYEKGKKQLSEGQRQYEEASKKLADGKKAYADGEKLIAEKEQQIADGKKQIAEAEAQLADAKAQLAEGEAQLKLVEPLYKPARDIYNKYKDDLGGKIAAAAINTLLRGSGFSTLDELFAQYDDAQAQIADAKAQIADGEAQIADGKKQIADGETELAAGKKQLAAAKTQLDEAEAQLAAARRELDAGETELASAEKQLAQGRRTMAQNSTQMAEDLEKLESLTDAQQVVEQGIAIILENDEIANLVSDPNDYETVLAVAGEYVGEQDANVDYELSLRSEQYSLLKIAAIICAVAGVLGLLAVIMPLSSTMLIAAIAGSLAAAAAIALNVFGKIKGYGYFVYALPDGSCSGDLQYKMTIALMGVAVPTAVLLLICLRAYRRAKAAQAANDERVAGGEDAFAVIMQESALPSESAPMLESSEQNDAHTEAQEEKSAGPDIMAARDSNIGNDNISDLRERIRMLNEETERIEAENRAAEKRSKDLNDARREYEEALKRFEKARSEYEGNKL